MVHRLISLIVLFSILSFSSAQASAPHSEPISGLTAANSSPTEFGRTTTLWASVESGSEITYYWDLGDGTRTQGAMVGHVYPHKGSYTALVTAVNPLGWQVATTRVVVELPNTFDFYLNMAMNPHNTGVPIPAP